MWDHKEYLMHHGVKGQKWGVRRYQNADGTLTEAGRKKYYTENGTLTKAGVKRVNKELKRSQKLKDRANLSKQEADVEKYGKRFKTAGKVALGAGGVALAIQTGNQLGAKTVNSLASKSASARQSLDNAIDRYHLSNKEVSNAFEEYQILNSKLDKSKIKERFMIEDAYQRLDRSRNDSTQANTDMVVASLKSRDARKKLENASSLYDKLQNPRAVATGIAAGVAAGAAGVAVYSKVRQKMAEKNIRDIKSGEASKRYQEHTQSMVNAFGSKTIRDAKNFNKKTFEKNMDRLGNAEMKTFDLESRRRSMASYNPKNASHFYDKPIAEARADRNAKYNKIARNDVARSKLENQYGYKHGTKTYDEWSAKNDAEYNRRKKKNTKAPARTYVYAPDAN